MAEMKGKCGASRMIFLLFIEPDAAEVRGGGNAD